MPDHEEKRSNERHDCYATAICSYFNTNRFFHAEITNFSAAGLYLESSQLLNPGTTVLILLKSGTNRPAGDSATGLKSVAIAEVKWCREIVSEGEYQYGAGLKYHFADLG